MVKKGVGLHFQPSRQWIIKCRFGYSYITISQVRIRWSPFIISDRKVVPQTRSVVHSWLQCLAHLFHRLAFAQSGSPSGDTSKSESDLPI